MLVSTYEFANIIFCESLVISEAISDYGAQAFAIHSPRASLPFYLITCSSPHRTSKDGDIMHSPGHLSLTLGADFNSHGLMFKASIYQFLWFSSHGSNSQALLLPYQLISVALHGSNFHSTCLYFWFSWAYYSSSKEEDSFKHNHLVYMENFYMSCSRIHVHRRASMLLRYTIEMKVAATFSQVFSTWILILHA